MNVICPKCSSRFNLNDNDIPPKGLRLSCGKCGNPIFVYSQEVSPVIHETSKEAPIIDQIQCPKCFKLVPKKSITCQYCGQRISFVVPKLQTTIADTSKIRFMGIAILVCGIAGIVFPPLGIGAYIFSIIQRKKAKENPDLYRDANIYINTIFNIYTVILIVVAILIVLAGLIFSFYLNK